MTIEQTVGFAEGDRGKLVGLDVGQQVDGVLDMRGALCRVPHDRGRILEGIADLAVSDTEGVSRIGGGRLG